MEQFIVKLKDQNRKHFLLELLKQLDFIELITPESKKEQAKNDDDFFKAEGIWKDKDVDADNLRKQAWKIQE